MKSLRGLNKTSTAQAVANLRSALRALELVGVKGLTPDPIVIVRAEINNALRYLEQRTPR